MTLPDDPPVDYAPLFALERGRLLDLLGGLDAADWELQSPCPAWTIHGVCCHLVGDDVSILARHRDGHHGTVPPAGSSEQAFVAWLDELQIEWVRAARRMSPRLVIDLLEWMGPQIVGLLGSQDPSARTGSVSWAGTAPVPVWLEHGREVTEYWVHRQQILQALGRTSDLRADIAGPVLDVFRWAYPFRLDESGIGARGAVQIEVTGPVRASWWLVATDHGWMFRDGDGAEPVARLSLTTDEAWRLLTNNLPRDDQAALDVWGEPNIVETLLRTRAVIGSPD